MTGLDADGFAQSFAAWQGKPGVAGAAARSRRAEINTRTGASGCYNLIIDDGHVA
jgi:hypothetical protein